MVHRAILCRRPPWPAWADLLGRRPGDGGDRYDCNYPLFSNYYVAAGSPAGVGAQPTSVRGRRRRWSAIPMSLTRPLPRTNSSINTATVIAG